MSKTEISRLEDELNRIFSLPEFQRLLPQQPRFRYFQVKKDKYAFAWTTEKCSNGKFYALKYRLLKPTRRGQTWKLVKKVAFARRRIAKARALKWYYERKDQLK